MSLDELIVFLMPIDGLLLFLSQLPGMRGRFRIYLVVGSISIAVATGAVLFYNTDHVRVLANHIKSKTSLYLSGPLLLAGAGAFVLFLEGSWSVWSRGAFLFLVSLEFFCSSRLCGVMVLHTSMDPPESEHCSSQ